MEEKARKYCLMYKMQPTLALTCLYRDLSQNLINGLCELLQDWCLYTAECDEAFIDFKIPLDFEQLYAFTFELLSRKLSDSLVISRAVYLLRNQRTPLKNLTSILENLVKCTQNESVMALSAVVLARMGKDAECISLCKKLSTGVDFDVLRSRLHLLCVADLELLKLTMQGNALIRRSRDAEIGINNSGYAKEDHCEKSFIRKHDKRHDGFHNTVSLTSLKNLHSTEIAETSFQNDTNFAFLNEVENTLSRNVDLSTYLIDVVEFHNKAGRTYHALWMLLRYYRDNEALPRLDAATTLELHEPLLNILRDLNQVIVSEKNEENNRSFQNYGERALLYCNVIKLFDIVDIEAGILHMESLCQIGKVAEAVDIGKELLVNEKQKEDVFYALACCKIHQGKYFSALDDINTAIKLTLERPDFVAIRGFVNVLAGNLSQGLIDITSSCKEEIATAVSRFRNLKPSDQNTIKDRISQCVKTCLDVDLVREAGDNDNIEGFSGSQPQQDFENKLQAIRWQCEFLTRIYQRDLSVHLLYVDVLIQLKRFEDAQELLVLFIHRVPDDPFPMIHLANLRLKLGAYVAAVQDFRSICFAIGSTRFGDYLTELSIEEREEIARVHRQHGFRYLHSEKSYADAIECFNIAIISLSGTATGLILVRGFCYANLGDYELALNDFLSVLQREPDNTAAIVSRSVIYSVFDHEEETLRGLGKVLKDSKEAAVKVLQKVPLNCVRHFATSLKNYINKVLDQKTSLIDPDAVDLAGVYSEFLSRTFKTSNYRCLYSKYLLTYGKYEDSLSEVEAVLKTEPDNHTALVQKVFLLTKFSKMRDCMCVLRTLHDANTDELEAYVGKLHISEKKALRGIVLKEGKDKAEAKDHQAAIRWFNIAFVVNGKRDIEILRGRFESYVDEGLTEKAVDDLSLIIDIKPTYEDYCVRAKLHDSLGKDKLAWNDYMKAIDIDEERTIQLLTDQSILKHVLCLFCMAANGAFVRESYKEVLKLCDFGLKLDPNHKGLKQLRYRTKCAVDRCVIQ